MVKNSNIQEMNQPNYNDGLELSKRLIYLTAIERLSAIFEQHGATLIEDQLFKLLIEARARSLEAAEEFGFKAMK
ncbi:hypothetical protein [Janthinobacterium sp. J1-1]|uniref:hypothetical protein n=1 Tax=Janthinobacterium sp. J1-1 TaxID=3065910 RepID=UPI002811CEE0|nr:hypothetical protein [Janthinobacterium sp. J1-1]